MGEQKIRKIFHKTLKWFCYQNTTNEMNEEMKQAGAELGQTQPQLGWWLI